MPVLMWVAIAVIVAGVYFVATGRGGEMAYEHADHAPLDLGSVTAADVALLRPPTAMLGYNMQVTDAALDAIAQAIRDRDLTIARLQQRLAALEPQSAAGGPAWPGPAEAAPAAHGWPGPAEAATRGEQAWHGSGWYEAPPRAAQWPQAGGHLDTQVPGGPEASGPSADRTGPSPADRTQPSPGGQAAASPGDQGPPAPPAAAGDDDTLAAEEQGW